LRKEGIAGNDGPDEDACVQKHPQSRSSQIELRSNACSDRTGPWLDPIHRRNASIRSVLGWAWSSVLSVTTTIVPSGASMGSSGTRTPFLTLALPVQKVPEPAIPHYTARVALHYASCPRRSSPRSSS
jgi:hypothetical protein